MKNLLIIVQKVDENDDHRSYFIDWLREFARKFDTVSVITIAKGLYSLPSNVRVYSLGKERGASKFLRVLSFYYYLLRLVPKSDGIFAHSSPVFVIASWPVVFLFRKRIVFWYLHRSVTPKLKLAEKLCYKLATASKESLGIKSDKIIEVSHGINVDFFRTERKWDDNDKLRILSVGRITKIKDYETLIRAARILKDRNVNINIQIVGQPVVKPDLEYFESLKSLAEKLDLNNTVEFAGSVPYNRIARFYKSSDLVIGLTPLGGIDKTILEGMASGCLVLTSNIINKKYFGPFSEELTFNYDDPDSLAQKIEFLSRMPVETKEKISGFLVRSVSENHNLFGLISRLTRLFI